MVLERHEEEHGLCDDRLLQGARRVALELVQATGGEVAQERRHGEGAPHVDGPAHDVVSSTHGISDTHDPLDQLFLCVVRWLQSAGSE